jgi:hypothetical protein
MCDVPFDNSDNVACLKLCAAFPLGDTADMNVNSIGCRQGYLQATTANCEAGGSTGGGLCGSYCEAYCNLTTAGCASELSNDECMAVCATYNATDMTEEANNLHCRVHAAEIAAASMDEQTIFDYCGYSSPHGNGGCGETCENYCMFSEANCMGTAMQYIDNVTCLAYCEQFPYGMWNDTMGNTLGCRVGRTFAASFGDNAVNCKVGAASGDNMCGTWCEVYCQLASDICQDENQLFENDTYCMDACANYSTFGKSGDANGDSVQCRIYHLGVAGISPANAIIHCPHANVTSTDNQCAGFVTSEAATTEAATTEAATTEAATTEVASTGAATTEVASTGASTTEAATTGAATTATTGAATTAAATTKPASTTGNALALCVSVLLMLVVLF